MKRYQVTPCAQCPWRQDVATGQFSPARYIALSHTSYDRAMTQFGCHKSPHGAEVGCAGFVLRGATHNLGARLAQIEGRLDAGLVSSAYPLYRNYRAMAIANGVDPGHPALMRCRDDQ